MRRECFLRWLRSAGRAALSITRLGGGLYYSLPLASGIEQWPGTWSAQEKQHERLSRAGLESILHEAASGHEHGLSG